MIPITQKSCSAATLPEITAQIIRLRKSAAGREAISSWLGSFGRWLSLLKCKNYTTNLIGLCRTSKIWASRYESAFYSLNQWWCLHSSDWTHLVHLLVFTLSLCFLIGVAAVTEPMPAVTSVQSGQVSRPSQTNHLQEKPPSCLRTAGGNVK